MEAPSLAFQRPGMEDMLQNYINNKDSTNLFRCYVLDSSDNPEDARNLISNSTLAAFYTAVSFSDIYFHFEALSP